MENKREFKKYVEALGGSLVEEMMSTYYNEEGIDKARIENAIGKVLGAIGAAKSHANIFFDRGAKSFEDAQAYSKAKREFFRSLFKKINSDFSAEIDAAIKEFNAALPESVKASQKEIATK